MWPGLGEEMREPSTGGEFFRVIEDLCEREIDLKGDDSRARNWVIEDLQIWTELMKTRLIDERFISREEIKFLS